MPLPTSIESLDIVPGQNITTKKFSASQIQQVEDLVRQFLSDANPTLDFGRGGVLFESVVRPLSKVYLVSRDIGETVIDTQSLSAVIANPELAIDSVVDAILSNLQITRKAGSFALGDIKLNLSKAATQNILSTTIFKTTAGLEFKPRANYRITLTPTADNDIQITQTSTGSFYAIIPAQAVEKGIVYQISDATSLTPSSSVSFFVSSSSFGDFYGGAEDETNEQIIARIPEAMSSRTLSSRLSISAVIKSGFDTIMDVSTESAQSPIMTRNARNAFKFKLGGFADTYVKPINGITFDTEKLTAKLQEIDSSGLIKKGVYLIDIPRDIFPGHYYISAIRPIEDSVSSFFISSQTKGVDTSILADGVAANVVTTPTEAAFSAFQTSQVIFHWEYDVSTGLSPEDFFESEAPVFVEFAFCPYILDIQKVISDKSSGAILSDILVRAVVPCIVSLPVIEVSANSYDVEGLIRKAVYDYVNFTSIGQPVRVDDLIVAIRSVPGVKSVDNLIRIYGKIYCPNGEILESASDSSLFVPLDTVRGVSPTNSSFFINYSQINVSTTLVP